MYKLKLTLLIASLALLSSCTSPTEPEENNSNANTSENTVLSSENGSDAENGSNVGLSSSDSKLSEDGTNTSSEGQSSTETDNLSQTASSSDKETSSSTTSATVGSNTQTCTYSESVNTLACAEKTYKTVVIGDQTWMAENLNYGNYLKSLTEDDDAEADYVEEPDEDAAGACCCAGNRAYDQLCAEAGSENRCQDYVDKDGYTCSWFAADSCPCENSTAPGGKPGIKRKDGTDNKPSRRDPESSEKKRKKRRDR